MSLRRSSLSSLHLLVAGVAPGLGLIRAATANAAYVAYDLALALLLAASIRAYLVRPSPWCFGFALFGWAHLFLSAGDHARFLPTFWLVDQVLRPAAVEWSPYPRMNYPPNDHRQDANFHYGVASGLLINLVVTLWAALAGAGLTSSVEMFHRSRASHRQEINDGCRP